MSKNISKKFFYQLPSGALVHPCRLIVRDGTIMWKHAFLVGNAFTQLPQEHAHEAHIVKTANRLEELNAWVSQGLDPWNCLQPTIWYEPEIPDYSEGIRVSFKHSLLDPLHVYEQLQQHLQPSEGLTREGDTLTFIRC